MILIDCAMAQVHPLLFPSMQAFLVVEPKYFTYLWSRMPALRRPTMCMLNDNAKVMETTIKGNFYW